MIQQQLKNAVTVMVITLIAVLFTNTLFIQDSSASDQVIRPFTSVRSKAMGGVNTTTGLYEENFNGNPARVTENKDWRIQILDIGLESTQSSISAIGDIINGGDDLLSNVANQAGENIHANLHLIPIAVYIPIRRTYVAFGVLANVQIDGKLRNDFTVQPKTVGDVDVALTVGRQFMDKALSVGITTHASYRMTGSEGFSLLDLLQGESISPTQNGGDGAHLDFDIGATYRLPWQPLGWLTSVGFSINSILGGKYENLGINILDTGRGPAVINSRTYNFGFTAVKLELWKLSHARFAFEINDIGRNSGGSFFRLLHIGFEAKWGVLIPRIGINQGYPGFGLGFDWPVVSLDLAYYGEETSLVAGKGQDRRIALRFGFKI